MNDALKPWKTIARRSVFSGGPIRDVVQESVLLPDGRVVPDYYTVAMGDFVSVYAVTTSQKVLVLRQYKHGPGRVCLTFPGGHIAVGEDPAGAVERELLEETGYRASRVTPLGSFVASANQRCSTAYLFRADGCRYEQEPNSGDLENMQLLLVRPEEVLLPDRVAEMGVLADVALAHLAARR